AAVHHVAPGPRSTARLTRERSEAVMSPVCHDCIFGTRLSSRTLPIDQATNSRLITSFCGRPTVSDNRSCLFVRSGHDRGEDVIRDIEATAHVERRKQTLQLSIRHQPPP